MTENEKLVERLLTDAGAEHIAGFTKPFRVRLLEEAAAALTAAEARIKALSEALEPAATLTGSRPKSQSLTSYTPAKPSPPSEATPMTVDEKGLAAGQRAAMVSNGCGCSWDGEHVFCDDARLPKPDTMCQCKKDALAAITAYLSARSAEPVADCVYTPTSAGPVPTTPPPMTKPR